MLNRRVWLLGIATGGALLWQGNAVAQFTQPRIGPYRAPEPNAVVRPADPVLRDWYEKRGTPRVAAPQRRGSSRVYRSPASKRIDGPRPFPYD